jgi:adenylylsulfate kinase-like enzyme
VPAPDRPCTVWLTGPPAVGKTTIATALAPWLATVAGAAEVIDGDVLRATISSDLDFSPASRIEQSRRAAVLARACNEDGRWAVVALVSPSEACREAAAEVLADRLRVVHLDAPEHVRRARDPKGLYARQAAGALEGLTGADAVYEAPRAPVLRLDTAATSVPGAVEELLRALDVQGR